MTKDEAEAYLNGLFEVAQTETTPEFADLLPLLDYLVNGATEADETGELAELEPEPVSEPEAEGIAPAPGLDSYALLKEKTVKKLASLLERVFMKYERQFPNYMPPQAWNDLAVETDTVIRDLLLAVPVEGA